MAILNTPKVWANDPISKRSHEVNFSMLTDILAMSSDELDTYSSLEELNEALLCDETYTEEAEYPEIYATGEAKIGQYALPYSDGGSFLFSYVVNFDDNKIRAHEVSEDMIDFLGLEAGEEYDEDDIIDMAQEHLREVEVEYMLRSVLCDIKTIEDTEAELPNNYNWSSEFEKSETGHFVYDAEKEKFFFVLDIDNGTPYFDNEGLTITAAQQYAISL